MEAFEILEIRNRYGLHARASTRLASLAQKYQSAISISRADGNQEVDGKSILGILTLGAERGTKIRLRAAGEDAPEAMKAIIELFNRNFDEE